MIDATLRKARSSWPAFATETPSWRTKGTSNLYLILETKTLPRLRCACDLVYRSHVRLLS